VSLINDQQNVAATSLLAFTPIGLRIDTPSVSIADNHEGEF
jgi:hypothetical protein